jgi:hypothetical protein
MSTPPKNISSDDAAFFQASLPFDNPNSDDGEDTEDPIGAGASKIGQLDMFHGFRPQKVKTGTRPTTGEPIAYGFQMTPGAKKNAVVAPTDKKRGPSGRRFA